MLNRFGTVMESSRYDGCTAKGCNDEKMMSHRQDAPASRFDTEPIGLLLARQERSK
jgi:hypothetical protein